MKTARKNDMKVPKTKKKVRKINDKIRLAAHFLRAQVLAF